MNQIMHRDVKPENFLFLERKGLDESPLKAIDFGLSAPYRTTGLRNPLSGPTKQCARHVKPTCSYSTSYI